MNPAILSFDSEARAFVHGSTWDANAMDRMLDVRDMAVMGATIERIAGRDGFAGVIRARFPHPKQGEPGVDRRAHGYDALRWNDREPEMAPRR
ncbi:hypothetical protein ACVWWI_006621 [Bradyrhizobium sp. USDA 3686]|nr:hypothetical protein [Bradyrhizobium canariense]